MNEVADFQRRCWGYPSPCRAISGRVWYFIAEGFFQQSYWLCCLQNQTCSAFVWIGNVNCRINIYFTSKRVSESWTVPWIRRHTVRRQYIQTKLMIVAYSSSCVWTEWSWGQVSHNSRRGFHLVAKASAILPDFAIQVMKFQVVPLERILNNMLDGFYVATHERQLDLFHHWRSCQPWPAAFWC